MDSLEEVFKGLPEKCPPIMEEKVKEILNYMKNPFVVAITVPGWKFTYTESGDGKPQVSGGRKKVVKTLLKTIRGTKLCYGIARLRVVKYAAKRAMESKLFDTLIWVTNPPTEGWTRKNFQMRMAEKLGIIVFPPDDAAVVDNSNNEEAMVSSRIRACLEKRSFLLVHNGDWVLDDLISMGIPTGMSGNYFKVVAVSAANLKYHQSIDFRDVDMSEKEEDVSELLCEEFADIAYSPNLRTGLIAPELVMECIFYLSLFSKRELEIQILLRHWYAQEFVNGLDLEAIFLSGMTLLEELHRRHLIHLGPKYVSFDDLWRLLQIVVPRKTSHRFLFIRSNTLDEIENPPPHQWEWEDIVRISFCDIPNKYPPSPPKFTNLSTLIVSDLPKFKTFPEHFLEHVKSSLRVLCFMDSGISSLPSSLPLLGSSLKLLNLRNCKQISHLDISNLRFLSKLEVLDLSNTPVEEIPEESFKALQSLRILDLSECSELSLLPSSMSCLSTLEQLLLGGCKKLRVLPSSIPQFEKLLLLDLSNATMMAEIPDQFFQRMHNLQLLNLSFCNLTSLPTSFSNLVNLKELNLDSCICLRTLVFGLSKNQVDGLFSLRGCPSLETITLHPNKNIEVLDLSGTKIKRFPLEGGPQLACLRRLDLLGVKHIQTVNWEEIRWLPQELNWDQCGDGNSFHLHFPPTEQPGHGIFISVTDANIFQSLTTTSQLWKKYLLHFSIYICPCKERGNGKEVPSPRARSYYNDIYSRTKSSVPYYERCLEVERVERHPKGISGVLSHTQFLSLHDERSVKRLSDLGINNMAELRECRFERCNAMEVIFDVQNEDMAKYQPLLSCLEFLRISNLMKLMNVCISRGTLGKVSFGVLKHLQLEYCPQLVNVFSSGVCLESLEVLEIKFCVRLQEVFSGESSGARSHSLERLHTLFLWELSNLKSIVCDVPLPSLKKAKVKGCPKLKKLPISSISSNNDSNKVALIEVTGESKWWEQLEWGDSNVNHQICFKSLESLRFPSGTQKEEERVRSGPYGS